MVVVRGANLGLQLFNSSLLTVHRNWWLTQVGYLSCLVSLSHSQRLQNALLGLQRPTGQNKTNNLCITLAYLDVGSKKK